ncbi:MAG: hypothetical protein ACLFUS_16040 [Candidatus Sumerlaeia bacterium]
MRGKLFAGCLIKCLVLLLGLGMVTACAGLRDNRSASYRVYQKGTHRISPLLWGEIWSGVETDEAVDQPQAPLLVFPAQKSARLSGLAALDDDVLPPGARIMEMDGFLRYSESLGAEPVITVDFGHALSESVDLNQAANLAAGIVAYCNKPVGAALPVGTPDWATLRARNGHPEPYGVTYFMLGGDWTRHVKVGPGQDLYARSEWIKICILTFIKKMKNVDASIQVIINGNGRDRQMLEFAQWRFQDSDIQAEADMASLFLPSLDSPVRYLMSDERGQLRFSSPLYPVLQENRWPLFLMQPLADRHAFGAASASSMDRAIASAGFIHAILRESETIQLTACDFESNGVTAGLSPEARTFAFYREHIGTSRLRQKSSRNPLAAPEKLGLSMELGEGGEVGYVDMVASENNRDLFIHAINRDFAGPRKLNVRLHGLKVADMGLQWLLQEKKEQDDSASGALQMSRQTVSLRPGKVQLLLPERSISLIQVRKR